MPWWTEAERADFFRQCVTRFGDFVPLDEVSPEAAQAFQRRGDLLATLVGLQQGRSNDAIRRAVTL